MPENITFRLPLSCEVDTVEPYRKQLWQKRFDDAAALCSGRKSDMDMEKMLVLRLFSHNKKGRMDLGCRHSSLWRRQGWRDPHANQQPPDTRRLHEHPH
jgi:hypothetical protein